jgi:hypothetical protein
VQCGEWAGGMLRKNGSKNSASLVFRHAVCRSTCSVVIWHVACRKALATAA